MNPCSDIMIWGVGFGLTTRQFSALAEKCGKRVVFFPPASISISMAHVSESLDSVFRRKCTSWSMFEDNHNLSQLHAKFWGKKIEDEARQWRELHPDVKVDNDNDIGSDCYSLDLGVGLRRSKLWVRQDYIRIYYYCNKRYERGPTSVTQTARSVVITGQPGVGVFLSPVAFRSTSNCSCVKR
jgi:hypothetical protein